MCVCARRNVSGLFVRSRLFKSTEYISRSECESVISVSLFKSITLTPRYILKEWKLGIKFESCLKLSAKSYIYKNVRTLSCV